MLMGAWRWFRFSILPALVLTVGMLHSPGALASSCPAGYEAYGECILTPMTPGEYTHNVGNLCIPPNVDPRLFSEGDAVARAEFQLRCFHEGGTTWRLCSLIIQPAGGWQTTTFWWDRVRAAKRVYSQTYAIRVSPTSPCSLPQSRDFDVYMSSTPYCPPSWSAAGAAGDFCYRIQPEACRIINPVQPASGAKLHAETDYMGGGRLPLEIKRHYRSDGNFVATGTAGRASRMGYSWRLSYDRWVSRSTTPDASRVYVVGGDGDYREFVLTGGNWTFRADTPERLVELKDGNGATTGWQYKRGDDAIELFDAGGMLLSITSRTGDALTMEYDGLGQLTEVADTYGRSVGFNYDAAGRITTAVDPAGITYHYTYDIERNLETVSRVSPEAFKVRYVYDSTVSGSVGQRYLLTGIIDENGTRSATYAYDQKDRVATVSHAGVFRHSITYSVPGGIGGQFSTRTVVIDPLGTTRTYSIASINRIAKDTGVTQPCPSCGQTAYAITYDPYGNVASRTDFNNKKVCYAYDLARTLETTRVEGLLAAESCTTALTTPPARPDVRKTTTTWHASFRLPLVLTEPADGGSGVRTTTHTYDGSGNLTQKTIVAPKNDGTSATVTRTWKWTYGPYGRVLTATDPNLKVTTTTYHADNDPDLGKRGNVATITNALGHVTAISTYDANSRPLSITDPNGVITTMTYHPRGWLTSRTVGGEATAYDYDGVGQLLKVTLPDSSIVQYTYDGAHRLTQIQDGLGNRIVYTLDAMGNRTREQALDPSGALARVRQQVYDSLNRLHQTVGAQ